MTAERRQRRSDERCEALLLQLDACRERGVLDAMILADRDGLCVATAGGPEASDSTCTEIAAQLPMIGDDMPSTDGLVLASGSLWNVHVRRFDMQGYPLYLCAVGGSGAERAGAVDSSVSGVGRILGS